MDDDAKADSKTNEEGSEDQLGFIQRLKLVFSEPSLVHCIAGLILVAIASSGLIAWMAPLLIRVHGMELATTGIIVALCIGLASSLGTAGTGLKVDAINKRSEETTSELQSLMRNSYAHFCWQKKNR